MKINKFPKGYKKVFIKNQEPTILQFDKNGGLCNMTPRIPDIFNQYKGRTRALIPEMINSIVNYYE